MIRLNNQFKCEPILSVNGMKLLVGHCLFDIPTCVREAAEGDGNFEWEPSKTNTGGLGRARQDEEQHDATQRQHFCTQQVLAHRRHVQMWCCHSLPLHPTLAEGESASFGWAAVDQITALEISQLTKAEHALMWTRVVRRIINTDPDKVGSVFNVWHAVNQSTC